MTMDSTLRLMRRFSACDSGRASARKLDALLDLGQLHDPRVVPFLLEVLEDTRERDEVRVDVVKRLRDARLPMEDRTTVARTLIRLLHERGNADPRLQAALALGEFTDLRGVVESLGAVAIQIDAPLEVRYCTFTSLQRCGATDECITILSGLSVDETLGPSARDVLRVWGLV